ncbi:vitamin K epoxide reductase family protein [Prauserella cavernicola]|uniref:Vitamin K epoxide reductase family protein n=1 Tax=Prauserella cavernicola TaxID=2800127 RepID=A0A934V9Q9_9PSEU|nr:vitamin K epoxide reductase family protein [Prauserella cavernicola]MBK1789103.1 vitamin K epoxide reductase family protein [Prauserella cavernicola]
MSAPATGPAVDTGAPARLRAIAAWVLTLGGIIGTGAAFVLTVEKIALLENPFYQPSCSIDSTLSCGSVMESAQAAAFGFPNPLLGLVGFPVVATVGVALLAGARLPRWFWLGLQAGTLFAVGFVHWLIAQSLYEIGALCPYCMIVWAVTIPIFWYTTVHNLAAGYLPGARALGETLARRHLSPLLLWLLLIAILIGQRFWSYWTGLFG